MVDVTKISRATVHEHLIKMGHTNQYIGRCSTPIDEDWLYEPRLYVRFVSPKFSHWRRYFDFIPKFVLKTHLVQGKHTFNCCETWTSPKESSSVHLVELESGSVL